MNIINKIYKAAPVVGKSLKTPSVAAFNQNLFAMRFFTASIILCLINCCLYRLRTI